MESNGEAKILGEFGKIKLEPEVRTDIPFLDADKIVQVIDTGEAIPPQAHPEDNEAGEIVFPD